MRQEKKVKKSHKGFFEVGEKDTISGATKKTAKHKSNNRWTS